MVRHVPVWFGHSYIVPLPKSKDSVSKPLSCEDFRGVSAPSFQKFSNIVSTEIWRLSLYRLQAVWFFKKGMGCNHAINTVRCVIEQLTKVNLQLI